MTTHPEVEKILEEFDHKFLMDMSWINRPDFPLPIQIWLRTTLTSLISRIEEEERERIKKELRKEYENTFHWGKDEVFGTYITEKEFEAVIKNALSNPPTP